MNLPTCLCSGSWLTTAMWDKSGESYASPNWRVYCVVIARCEDLGIVKSPARLHYGRIPCNDGSSAGAFRFDGHLIDPNMVDHLSG